MRTNKQLMNDVDLLSTSLSAEQRVNEVLTTDIKKLYIANGLLSFALACVIGGSIAYGNYKSQNVKELTISYKNEIATLSQQHESFKTMMLKSSNSNLFSISKAVMLEDMKQYTYLSPKTKNQIVQAILEEAEKYKINPLILYAICHVESTFRPWLEHSLVTIEVNGKTIKTRAVGLCGIMYEAHKDDLLSSGLIDSKGDLYDAVTNIKVAAYILDKYTKLDLLKGTKTKDESALFRYFGKNDQAYIQRINTKIMEVISLEMYRK